MTHQDTNTHLSPQAWFHVHMHHSSGCAGNAIAALHKWQAAASGPRPTCQAPDEVRGDALVHPGGKHAWQRVHRMWHTLVDAATKA